MEGYSVHAKRAKEDTAVNKTSFPSFVHSLIILTVSKQPSKVAESTSCGKKEKETVAISKTTFL